MAQKSRFRTTSGPSTNKSEKFKTKAQREKEASREGKAPFKSFGAKKPFGKKDFRDKDESASSSRSFRGDRPKDFSSDRKRPFKTNETKGKPFVKKDFRDKEKSTERGDRNFPGRGETYKSKSFEKPSKPGDNSREFSERKPKSFSREGNDKSFRRDSPQFSDRYKSDKNYTSGYKKEKNFGDNKSNTTKRPRSGKPYEETVLPTDDLIRLNRFISNSGICSRREADDMIKAGLITVNGKAVTELGFKVRRTDDVRHDGKRLKAEKPVYILLNKPKGFITTTDDPQERNTVMHLITGACKERVYPVGRLDRNTSGLLLLTNDGDLTEKLSHPKHNVRKIYKAELDRPITKNDFQKIVDGVRLEEGRAMVDDVAIASEDGKTVGLEIHIGWNRVVRRIFETLGYDVVKLDRSVYAGLDKKDLSRGHWRFLRQDEVIRLKHFL